MTPVKAFVLIAALGTLAACGKTGEKKNDAKAVGSGAAEGTLGNTSGSGSPATTKPAPVRTSGAGLFDFCAYKAGTKGGGCFTCTPRDLDLLKCAKEVKAEFDAAKDCTHDADKLVLICDVGGSEDISWNLKSPSKTEQFYEKLPILVSAGKLLLEAKFKDNPKKELIFSALDLLAKHAKTVLNGSDVSPVAADVVALAKKAKPNIADADIAKIKAPMISVLNGIQERRKNGELGDGDMVTLISGFIATMPPELLGSSLNGADISAVVSLLVAAKPEDLSAILGAVGGGSSGLGAGGPTGTTTGASAGSGS